MTRLQQQIVAVQKRQQHQWMLKCVTWGGIVSGSIACVVAFVGLMIAVPLGWTIIGLTCLVGPAMGLVYAGFTAPSQRDAARTIDSVCGLQDRTLTALQFQQSSDAIEQTSLHRLQIADAGKHAELVHPERVVPSQRRAALPIAVMLSVAAIVMTFFSGPRTEVLAAAVSNDVVRQQAAVAQQGLDELKDMQDEKADPEIETLVKDLQAMIDQMNQAGTDPKEALAKLSEMEASLQEMQRQVDDPQAAAQLQQLGHALSLSEAMAKAGEALAKGDMEKAAEQLEQLEMPKLDRKTEKSVIEKLNKLSQNSAQGNSQQSLQQAASEIGQGLGQGNRGKFSDGMKRLAREARKQGSRKKLSMLLKKQCKCLCECKSKCECECRKQSQCIGKGGTKAGSGVSGNKPGDKTAALKAKPQMNLKGQESAQGDVDIETQESDPQEQAAVRAYEQKASQYEALSESALDSESIPLGHRQTIRKYFELIRPNN